LQQLAATAAISPAIDKPGAILLLSHTLLCPVSTVWLAFAKQRAAAHLYSA
jgi:hypothetical protein